MIKIDIAEKGKYYSIREEYLNRISSYVKFNKEDIIYGGNQEIHSEDSISTENKTEESAKKLKEDFPRLYDYLFDKKTNELMREKLRFLLIGPDEMPQSFGGNGAEETMKGYLKKITFECPLPDESEKKIKAKDCCKDIFNYIDFIKKQEDAYWLLRELNVRVCPYCNRIYTVTLPSPEELDKDEKFRASRATFDHFFCQSKFPYLALSLFNLVPSCFSCNMSKKNKEDIIYPYEEEFGKEVVFRVIPDMKGVTADHPCNILGFLHGENDRFHIKFMNRNVISLREDKLLEDRLSGIKKNELRNSIQASIDTLNLEQLYKEHKMEIREILRNRYYFDEQYIKTVVCPIIQQKIRKKKSEQINEKELERMAMNMLFFTHINESEWGKRPLSKLVADILEQVEVFGFE